MKALVTGASGFTGSYLVENLLEHNFYVRALVRSTSNTERLKDQGVELVFGDLRNIDEVDAAVKGMDIVFHIAAVFRSAGIPDSVILNEIPIAVKDRVGLLRDFKFAKVADETIVIVDPAKRQIVDIVTKTEGSR